MLKNLTKKISDMTGAEILRFKKREKNNFLISVVLIMVVYIYGGANDNPLIYWFAFIVMIALVLLHVLRLAFIEKGVRNILCEHIDLDRYQDIFEHYSAYGQNRARRSRASKAFYFINMAQIYYLRGDFEMSLKMLSEFKPTDFNSLQTQSIARYYYLEFLNKVFNRDSYDLQHYVSVLSTIPTKFQNQKELISQQVNVIKMIDSVVTEKIPITISVGSVNNHLEQVELCYYKALNHLNQNQPEEAKACFQEIVNENSELFYVKEAKKYLEELA